MSAGRVQSIALRIITEREREIEKFISQDYYRIFVSFEKSNKDVEFELVEFNGKKLEI